MPEIQTLTMNSDAIFSASPWSIETAHLRAFLQSVRTVARIEIGGSEPQPLAYRMDGRTARIPIRGVLLKTVPGWVKRYDRAAATGYDEIREMVTAAIEDSGVKDITFDIESPGGTVAGLDDIAMFVRSASAVKPTRTYVDNIATSAAYYIAAQTGEIHATIDAEIGSIGTFTYLYDTSAMAEEHGVKVIVIRSGEHKGVGIPGAPISDTQIEAVQEIVNGLAELFINAVADGRKMSVGDVRKLATGQYWLASRAKDLGLIDKITKNKSFSKLHRKEKNMSNENPTVSQVDEAAIKAEAAVKAQQEYAARITAMNAAFPKDAAYAMQALAKGQTVIEAKAEYADVLEARNSELAAKLEKKGQTGDGAPPVENIGEGTSGGAMDFVGEARRIATEKRISYVQAARQLNRERPELHKSYLEKCRSRRVSKD